MFRKKFTLTLTSGAVFGKHVAGKFEQFRTDFQLTSLGGDEIDVETDFAVLNGKINNPSMRGEIIHVADGQNARPDKRAQNFIHAPPLGPADENQMATL